MNYLNQKLNEKADIHLGQGYGTHSEGNKAYPKDKAKALDNIKSRSGYPKQENEHNAVADARWNKRLHEFINTVAC